MMAPCRVELQGLGSEMLYCLCTTANNKAGLPIVEPCRYNEAGLQPSCQFSEHYHSDDYRTAGVRQDVDVVEESDLFDVVPDFYRPHVPVVEAVNCLMSILNHGLLSLCQQFDVDNSSRIPVIALMTGVLAVSLTTIVSAWRLMLERRTQGYESIGQTCCDHSTTEMMVVMVYRNTQKHLEPDAVYNSFQARVILILLSTFVLISSTCVMLCCFFTFPILLKSSFVQTAMLLVLYLGVCPSSAFPVRQSVLSLSGRQSNTMWTMQLRGWPNTGYCVMMRFGINNQQMFCMLVDTGSANTAVAAMSDPALGNHEFFDPNLAGEDFVDMGKTIKVTYSSGEWCGNLVRDMVGFGVFNMEMSYFSLITTSTDFFIEGAEWVGILGMAYESLAKPDSSVGTVWDTIRPANTMQDVFSLQLCPPKESTLFPGTFIKQGGYMTLGGVNSSLYQVGKQLHYTRIVEERFFSVLLTKIAVGEKVINMSCKEFNNDKTIVDSGTTDIFFPVDVFQEVKNTFTEYFKGGLPLDVPDEFWVGEQKLLWQAAHIEEIFQSFPTLYLSMAADDNDSQEFCLALVPQLYLRQIDVQVGEADPAVCPSSSPCDAFTFGVKPRTLGTVIGGNAMLGYYTVFDRANNRVGFAESTCEYRSYDTTPYISGPYSRDPEDCQMHLPVTQWDIITYCCGAVTVFLALIMIVIVCVRVIRRSKCIQQSKCKESIRKRIPRRMETNIKKTETALKSGGWICCTLSRTNDDEGYFSENHGTSVVDTEDSAPDTPVSSTSSGELIVPRPVTDLRIPLDDDCRGVIGVVEEGIEMHRAVVEGDKSVSHSKKRKRKRKTNRNFPVMETQFPDGDQHRLCILGATNVNSLPGAAMSRTSVDML